MVLKVLLSLLLLSVRLKLTVSSQIGCLICEDIDDEKINVHLVPHSHDDVGWLKTVEQYYYGLKSDIQKASVQNIIDSVVEALLANPDRRYIQVETAFFWKWWNLQDDDMRNKFKSLVDNGQIEIVNGAWSMNDEACTNYQSTIDQFTWGLSVIDDTIGACGTPRVGWQIDPFGHSREQASLFAQLGYDGLFFARLDINDKTLRMINKNLDFAWQSSANLDDSIIFGGIFVTTGYYPPGGFCWDYYCNDVRIDNNQESFDYNVDSIRSNFGNLIKSYTNYYKTKNILIPMGGDFQFEAAEINFLNMDKMIEIFRNDSDIKVMYSTPSCYIKAVNNSQPTLKLKIDDFFPYGENDVTYWTGYFTSRPNSKRFERIGHSILQATKQIVTLSGLIEYSEDNVNSLQNLRETMGIMQHHDAITGTAKQHVVNDYVRMLTKAIKDAEQPMGAMIGKLLQIDKNETLDLDLQLSSCLLSNISICSVSQDSQRFIVAVYNPLAWTVTHYVRLPVENENFNIQGPDGTEDYDVVNTIPYFAVKMNATQSNYELVFAARNVPPMGIKLYYITRSAALTDIPSPKADDDFIFGDTTTGFEIDPYTNLLKSVTMNGITLNITQNFYYYFSEIGQADRSYVASGAYLFRPNKTSPESFKNVVSFAGSVRGNLVDEFHQKWNDDYVNISQIIRVYKTENYIEFDWLVGGISIEDQMGKEVISKFSVSHFDNDMVFHTDSNGRETLRRMLDYRPDYILNAVREPVASNYYPVTSKISIKDDFSDIEVAVLTDRSQGGSSLNMGEIELMVHRRILHDDNKGVAESLNETEFDGSGVYVRGSHYLVFGYAEKANPDGKYAAAQQRILAQKKLVQPWVGVGNADSDSLAYGQITNKLKLSYSALARALPENVNILTFEPWKNETILLRVEHILEQHDDPTLSATATINLNTTFASLAVTEITETTLGANQALADFKDKPKYKWNTTGYEIDDVPRVNDTSELEISLTPMQIRTFIIRVAESSAAVDIKPLLVMMLFTALLYLSF